MAEMSDYQDYIVEGVINEQGRTIVQLKRASVWSSDSPRYIIPIQIQNIKSGDNVTFRTIDFGFEGLVGDNIVYHSQYIWAGFMRGNEKIITLRGRHMYLLEEQLLLEEGHRILLDSRR